MKKFFEMAAQVDWVEVITVLILGSVVFSLVAGIFSTFFCGAPAGGN